jgi:DNA-binding CsgD family transcriptional regulator
VNFSPRQILISGNSGLQNIALVKTVENITGMPTAWFSTQEFLKRDRASAEEPILTFLDFDSFPEKELPVLFEKNRHPHISGFALFNLCPDHAICHSWVPRGLRGVFYEGENFEIFVKGVHTLVQGELWFPRSLIKQWLLQESPTVSRRCEAESVALTSREEEILLLLAHGLPRQSIAEKLFIAPNTVKTHINNAYKKIGARNSLQAALWVLKHYPEKANLP